MWQYEQKAKLMKLRTECYEHMLRVHHKLESNDSMQKLGRLNKDPLRRPRKMYKQ